MTSSFSHWPDVVYLSRCRPLILPSSSAFSGPSLLRRGPKTPLLWSHYLLKHLEIDTSLHSSQEDIHSEFPRSLINTSSARYYIRGLTFIYPRLPTLPTSGGLYHFFYLLSTTFEALFVPNKFLVSKPSPPQITFAKVFLATTPDRRWIHHE